MLNSLFLASAAYLLFTAVGLAPAATQSDQQAVPVTTPLPGTATPPADDAIVGVDWGGVTFIPRNLGPQKLDEQTFAKTVDYPQGLAFQSNGDLLATIGRGTTPDMRIEKWTGTVQSHFVQFQWHDYTAADFRDSEKMKERVDGETRGIFWFFGGPIAVDGKDQVYFNLGPCGPNGIYQLLQVKPIKVQMLFPSDGFWSLQFFPSSSEDLCLTSFSKIVNLDLTTAKTIDEAKPLFSMIGGHASLLNTLLVDVDHILATLAVNHLDPTDPTHKKRLASTRVAVIFDRKLQGYYVLDFKDWGPMAIRPRDKALFRFDADAKEIKQFSLPFLAASDSSQATPTNQPGTPGTGGAAQSGADVAVILSQSRDAYAALTSYCDSGTMSTRMGSFSQDGTFSIRMQRPSLYRISWAGIGGGGIAWSDGTGDYLRFAGSANEKQKDRQTVLAGATGISGNVASTVPASFFHEQWGAVLSGIGDCQILPDETVDDISCKVITSVIQTHGADLKMKLWIGQSDHLIHQFEETTSGLPSVPAVNDAAIKSMLQRQNKPVTPEAIAALRLQLTNAQTMAKKMMQSGVVFTQVHHNIHTNQTFVPTDFRPEK
jgi:hypothetical protein